MMGLKGSAKLIFVSDLVDRYAKNGKRYRKNKLPSTGTVMDPEDRKLLPESVAEYVGG
jgi:hypothetical protein